jgi:hypothetical protein
MLSKPIDLLTPADIEQHPIWEFAIDEEGIEGQDETWVRPFHCRAFERILVVGRGRLFNP